MFVAPQRSARFEPDTMTKSSVPPNAPVALHPWWPPMLKHSTRWHHDGAWESEGASFERPPPARRRHPRCQTGSPLSPTTTSTVRSAMTGLPRLCSLMGQGWGYPDRSAKGFLRSSNSPSLAKTACGSRPANKPSSVSFLIAICALHPRQYGPAHKIPDSPALPDFPITTQASISF
jgi:hypothetical protein